MALNKLYLFIGGRGTGKTTACLKVAKASRKKNMVMDDVVHPAYNGFERISVNDVASWKGSNCIVNVTDLDEALRAIGYNQSNVFCTIEDSSRFIGSNISGAVKTFIINHRKINADIAFMFHSLKEVPPYLATNYNKMVLFKTGDNTEVNQPKWLDWKLIKAKHEKIMKSKNNNDCVVIDKG